MKKSRYSPEQVAFPPAESRRMASGWKFHPTSLPRLLHGCAGIDGAASV